MKRIVAFRVDSGNKIGIGHAMRCLTLARSMKSRAIESIFICRSSIGSIEDSIENAGFTVYRLPQASRSFVAPIDLMHGDFLASSQEEDAEQTQYILNHEANVYSLIVDHYGIDKSWDKNFRSKYKIYKIDDLADRHHDCDGLVDQNFYLNMDSRYRLIVPPNCNILSGPKYALLRPEFKDININCRKNRRGLGKILISFGGQDIHGYGLQIAQDLLENTPFQVTVLGLPVSKFERIWQCLTSKYGNRLVGPRYEENPQSVLMDADLYIGAGGTITWERFACGLPGIVYSIAKNQVAMAKDLESAGYQTYAGEISQYSWQQLRILLESLTDKECLWRLSQKLRLEVDGHGVERVLDAWNFRDER